jgi:hypothetical protein
MFKPCRFSCSSRNLSLHFSFLQRQSFRREPQHLRELASCYVIGDSVLFLIRHHYTNSPLLLFTGKSLLVSLNCSFNIAQSKQVLLILAPGVVYLPAGTRLVKSTVVSASYFGACANITISSKSNWSLSRAGRCLLSTTSYLVEYCR